MQEATIVASPPRPARVDYDSVIVGTSPICLITALVEEAQGKRVLMVDTAPAVGGTWRTTEILGFGNVELGCHGIDADRNVYRLLEDLGVNLLPMQPQPFVYSVEPRFFPRRVSFRHRWLRDLYDVFSGDENFDLPGENSRSLTAILKGLQRVARYATMAARGTNHPARYPTRGAIEIITRLEALVRTAGVEIRTSSRLSDVVLNREAGNLSFNVDGECLTAGRMHITSSSELSRFGDAAADIDVKAALHTWQALYLVLRGCPTTPFSYIVFSQDELLHRASDLSRYAIPSPQREGTHLIALTINENSPEDETTAAKALDKLKRMKLVAPDSVLEDYAYLPYRFTRLDVAGRRSLTKALQPLVQVIESDTLTRSLKLLLRGTDVRPMLQRVAGLPVADITNASRTLVESRGM